eukprot:5528269-Pyramimonas_sp.AAC.1
MREYAELEGERSQLEDTRKALRQNLMHSEAAMAKLTSAPLETEVELLDNDVDNGLSSDDCLSPPSSPS